eukprot:6609380-Pyramimonas_sp.AAC.1
MKPTCCHLPVRCAGVGHWPTRLQRHGGLRWALYLHALPPVRACTGPGPAGVVPHAAVGGVASPQFTKSQGSPSAIPAHC